MPSSDWFNPDHHFKRCIKGRKLKFTLLPRRCYITKRIIWLEFAYCLTAGYRARAHFGDSIYVYEHRWYDKDEYLVARLRDLI